MYSVGIMISLFDPVSCTKHPLIGSVLVVIDMSNVDILHGDFLHIRSLWMNISPEVAKTSKISCGGNTT